MSEPITFDDFAKVEIRIGTVVEAEVPEGSRSVIKLTVDFGPAVAGLSGGKRTIFTGILKWYKPEDLQGKQFPFVLNIPPRKMGELGMSEGMIMAAVENEGNDSERVLLLQPSDNVVKGSRVR